MDLNESGQSHKWRSGGEVDFQAPLAASHEFGDELPMAINLRGDEAFFADFSLDAEEVMEQLCIKRSRLRQISGKELRVARKRVERYVKPFYRPEDVQEYQEWTRPTASHQRSSLVLNSAADNLFEQSRAVTEHLDSLTLGLSKQLAEIGSAGRDRISDLALVQNELMNQMRAAGSERRNLEAKLRASLIEGLELASVSSEKQSSRLAAVLEDLLLTNQSFVEAIGLVQSSHRLMLDLQLSHEVQIKSLEDVNGLLSGLIEESREASIPRHKIESGLGGTAKQRNLRSRHRNLRSSTNSAQKSLQTQSSAINRKHSGSAGVRSTRPVWT